ncbi:FkbM family methyltransferase [Luteimonas salinilitoris]|uniref:FkbM family methyltransferase n=1 Tax=Luteimonas salinilitoris TaxID=3237697 RepID=A0ABV4HMI6_9GAMM
MALKLQQISGLGRRFLFLLADERDHIQGVLGTGRFYEAEELELISSYAAGAEAILDIGANIGNHSVYFAHRFSPRVLIPVEPNPAVTDLLRANMGLNWHPSMDLSMVGVGFSDRSGRAESIMSSPMNVGGARLRETGEGPVPVRRADDALPDRTFDLIKIDVEGMESEVIAGMSGILRRSDATVFVEVLIEHIDQIISSMAAHGYEYATSYQRYGRCVNLLFQKASRHGH